jgi:hypothetical protein
VALQALVHAPQPIRERSHYENRKVWHFIHKKNEALLGDGSHLAMSLRAVATLGDPSIRAISPKMSPCASVSITLPFSSISTSPERTKYILSPLSPSLKITSPGAKLMGGDPAWAKS